MAKKKITEPDPDAEKTLNTLKKRYFKLARSEVYPRSPGITRTLDALEIEIRKILEELEK